MTDEELTEILRNYDLTDPVQVLTAFRKVAAAAEAKALDRLRARWREDKSKCED